MDLTDEQIEALAAEAERGYDVSELPRAEGWVYAALCSWANRMNKTGAKVYCRKDKNVVTIVVDGEPQVRVTIENLLPKL